MTGKVKTLLVASGGGTDADAIMTKHIKGCFDFAHIAGLVSTKRDEKCLEKAAAHNIINYTIARSEYSSLDDFNDSLGILVGGQNIELIFLVGCVHRIYSIKGVTIKNIHPADPVRHGGKSFWKLLTKLNGERQG